MTVIPDSRWDLEGVRSHFTTKLPLAALLGIEVIAAESSSARVRLVGSERIVRPRLAHTSSRPATSSPPTPMAFCSCPKIAR